MYTISIDGKPLYYPSDEECVVIDPEIKCSINEAGSAVMTVPPVNPLYDSIHIRNSMISVTKNSREVFYGEVRSYTTDKNRHRKLTAVGALAFLNDSRQPQVNYGHSYTPLQFLTAVLEIHNNQMFDDDRKKIYVGDIRVGNTLNATDKITDNESTLEAIRKNLISVHGGTLRLRHENNLLYLDYVNLNDYGSACTQEISIGENLMDYTENFSADSVKTVVIPYGARLEDEGSTSEFEERVDITSVNDGKNYILGASQAIDNYGYVWTVVTYDGITNPASLKNMGQTYLRETQFEKAVFILTAVDLSALDSSIDAMYLGDRVPVRADMFGLNGSFPIIEMTMKPTKPQDERIVMSANLRTKKVSLTGHMLDTEKNVTAVAKREAQRIEKVIQAEVANIMNRFNGAYGGYKIEEYDQNGLWLRTLYMDQPDKDIATNIMEISMNGIRFSTEGYADATSTAWKSAWTLDGKFVAQEIFSNIVFANLLKVGIIEDVAERTSWNLETGDFISRGTDEKLVMKQAYLRGYSREFDPSVTPDPQNPDAQYYDELVGTLDLSANYADNVYRVALRSETELMLQANQNEIIVGNDETRFAKQISVNGDIHSADINCEDITCNDISCGDITSGGKATITGKITCGSVVPANGATNNISWKQSNGLDVSITVKNGIITAINKTEPAPDPT